MVIVIIKLKTGIKSYLVIDYLIIESFLWRAMRVKNAIIKDYSKFLWE